MLFYFRLELFFGGSKSWKSPCIGWFWSNMAVNHDLWSNPIISIPLFTMNHSYWILWVWSFNHYSWICVLDDFWFLTYQTSPKVLFQPIWELEQARYPPSWAPKWVGSITLQSNLWRVCLLNMDTGIVFWSLQLRFQSKFMSMSIRFPKIEPVAPIRATRAITCSKKTEIVSTDGCWTYISNLKSTNNKSGIFSEQIGSANRKELDLIIQNGKVSAKRLKLGHIQIVKQSDRFSRVPFFGLSMYRLCNWGDHHQNDRNHKVYLPGSNIAIENCHL